MTPVPGASCRKVVMEQQAPCSSQGDPWKNSGAAKPPSDPALLETHLLVLLAWNRSLLPSHPNMQLQCQRGFHNLLCDMADVGKVMMSRVVAAATPTPGCVHPFQECGCGVWSHS